MKKKIIPCPKTVGVTLTLLLVVAAADCRGQVPSLTETEKAVTVAAENYRLHIIKEGFRYRFERPGGEGFVPAHATSGLQLAQEGEPPSDVQSTVVQNQEGNEVVLGVEAENGVQAEVVVLARPHQAQFSVRPQDEGTYTLIGRTGGISPAYGLADHDMGPAPSRGSSQ